MSARRVGARRPKGWRDAGVASIELVSYAFVLVLVAVAGVQGVLLTQATSVAQQAARDGARAPALGRDISTEVRQQVPDPLRVADIRTSATPRSVRVEVDVRVPFVVPGIDASFVVTRDAVMPRG